MKAIVIDTFGSADRLHPAEVETPRPKSDEVLIRVVCAGVNPVDWKIREGLLESLFPHQFPLIPGWDVAGTVEAVGNAATGFGVGDRVYAYARKPVVQAGTYAEYVTMTATAVAPMPDCLSFAEAAAVPLAALTSWQALFDCGHLIAGQSVLIHAAAGGTGSFGVQFARQVASATVFATASSRNHDYIRLLGAEHLIDYEREDFVRAVKAISPSGVDLVYATVGGDVLHNSYRVVRAGGQVVSIVDAPAPEAGERFGIRVGYVFVAPNGGQLREITRLFDAGCLRAPAITEFPLEEAAAAQNLSAQGHVRGKIVLRVASN